MTQKPDIPLMEQLRAISDRHFDTDRFALANTLQENHACPEDYDSFLDDYFTTLNIDPKGFRFSDYFDEETGLWGIIFDLIDRAKGRGPKRLLTYQHLLDVAEKGKWFDPPPPAAQ